MKDARIEYADIIDLPHHVSKKRAPMSLTDRAAQFSPFAALTGYDDLIAESARWTEAQAELDESEKERLGRALRFMFDSGTEAVYSWFVPDERKPGGAYRESRGTMVRYDGSARRITLDSGETIPIDAIRAIESDDFDNLDMEEDLD